MEKIVIATFDPTVMTHRPVSEWQKFSTMKFQQAGPLHVKLCTAHLRLKKKICLVTAATIRNWTRKGAFSVKNVIYYDPYTGLSCNEEGAAAPEEFIKILQRDSTQQEITRFFVRCKNISQSSSAAHTCSESEEPDLVLPSTSAINDPTPVLTPIRRPRPLITQEMSDLYNQIAQRRKELYDEDLPF